MSVVSVRDYLGHNDKAKRKLQTHIRQEALDNLRTLRAELTNLKFRLLDIETKAAKCGYPGQAALLTNLIDQWNQAVSETIREKRRKG